MRARANPAQGPAVFGQEVLAITRTTFGWSQPAGVVYLRGGLDLVGGYGVDFTNTLALATTVTDATAPAPGAGFYYLVKPDCAVGSWQSSLGAEPGRDAVLP